MKRKNQEGSQRPRKSGDAAPRYNQENSRKFSDRDTAPWRGNSPRTEDRRPPFKKEGSRFSREEGSERNFGADKRRFSSQEDRPRFNREQGSERNFGTDKRRFSSQKDSPRFSREEGSERKFGTDKRKFSPQKDSSRFSKERDPERRDRSRSQFDRDADRSFGNDRPPRFNRERNDRFSSSKDTPRFPGGRDSERNSGNDRRRFSSQREADQEYGRDRSSFGFRRNSEDNSFRKYDRESFRSSSPEEPGKRKFGRRADDDSAAGRKKGDSFEYGKGAKPQRRPDYSEENLIRNIPEKQQKKLALTEKKATDKIRLNRYIANSGLCSRREADDLIESGQITVNGQTITEMGYQVKVTDVVKYGRKILNPEKLVYVLLNKPKDFITTTEDPEGRRTVMELVAKAGPERIYPVGRLDRATTGLLLFTNDGELADKLSHPSHEIRKIYQVEIDKPLSSEDFDRLIEGVELEDGFIKPDEVSVITPDQQVIGIEIHSGKNRVVRRIFEHLGYEVTQLDRTTYAGLTKKDLPRGNWRFLTEKEVIRLKYMI